MRRSRCYSNKVGLYFAAFGIGMVVALMCPKGVTVGVLAIVIVILGIVMAK